MIFYIFTIIFTIYILWVLIGIYYLLKQDYNNPFIEMVLMKDKLKLFRTQKIKKEIHKKLTLILSVQSILVILLALISIFIFKSHNITLRYTVLIILFSVKFISNKFIEIILYNK